jgi:hypothetical protein
MEIPRLHLDRVDMQVGYVDVTRLRRQAPRIDAGTAVVEFVAASVRQREAVVAVTDPGKFRGEIGEMVGDDLVPRAGYDPFS